VDDAECNRARHHQHGRRGVQAQNAIPAKRGGAKWPMQGIRAQMHQAFPVPRYRQRSLMERVISAVKCKLAARAPGRTHHAQGLQALLLGLAYTIYRWWCCQCTGHDSPSRMSIDPNGGSGRILVTAVSIATQHVY
jgi:hypothetical protein